MDIELFKLQDQELSKSLTHAISDEKYCISFLIKRTHVIMYCLPITVMGE